MKTITITALTLTALSVSIMMAQADEPQVKLISFISAGTKTRVAELCGRVTNAPAAGLVAVHIVVDEKTDSPSHYNVMVGNEGKFCAAVVTYRGTAIASIRRSNGAAADVYHQEIRLSSEVR